MQLLRIVRNFEMYNPGEQAGFDDSVATRLVERGLAIPAPLPVPTVEDLAPAPSAKAEEPRTPVVDPPRGKRR